MIIEFSVQNFRSIKEMQTLSMVAAPLKSKNPQLDKDNVIRVSDKLSLLKSAAIYGANGSGKSNLIKAISSMSNFIELSMNSEKAVMTEPQPFLLNNTSSKEPSYYQMQFLIDKKKYRYGFEVNNKRVVSEWLFGTADKNEVYYFIRELDEIKVNGSRFKEGEKLEDKTSPTNLFLNVANAFNGQISKSIKNFFKRISFGSEKPAFRRKFTINFLESMSEVKDTLIQILSFADFKIIDIKIIEIDGVKKVFFEREIYDENETIIGTKLMSLENSESVGTANYFDTIVMLFFNLVIGQISILDEFDESMHPLLAKSIIRMMNFPVNNIKNGQLIFATHDTNLLDANLLRRDQILFTEKNKKNETELYSLYDFKGVRNDASYEKDYFKGKYGGIPFVGDFETLFEEAV